MNVKVKGNVNVNVNMMRGQQSAVPIASSSRIEEWLREKSAKGSI